MSSHHRLYNRQRLMLVLGLLLCAGFMVTSLLSYVVSRNAIRSSIIDLELPLTSDNIYTEIQKDLVRPIFISSMMASDTFLRDWVLHGEKNADQITRYLKEVQQRYGAFTSFFVSDKTATYYQTQGILKKMNPQDAHDVWYYQVRNIDAPYRIDVDSDQANGNRLTIFINYKVFDYEQHLLGVVGVGLTMEAVHEFIADYQQRYRRNIYFVDRKGNIVLFGNRSSRNEKTLAEIAGLKELAPEILHGKDGSFHYVNDGREHLLNVRFIPELNWYLFVETREDEALAGIRQTLYINLALCLGITALVLFILHLVLKRYQGRLEKMAVTDKLTGLYNRQAFELLIQQTLAEQVRSPQPLSVLMMDIDHFKAINDRLGHLCGDALLKALTPVLRQCLRQSDLAFRWGGEEYLILLKGNASMDATGVAEKLREAVAHHPFHLEGGDGIEHITLSIGVAERQPAEAVDSLIARADHALYSAKSSGRNRVMVAAATGRLD